jgi:hypothetical protein
VLQVDDPGASPNLRVNKSEPFLKSVARSAKRKNFQFFKMKHGVSSACLNDPPLLCIRGERE